MIVYQTIPRSKIKWFRSELLAWGKQHRRKFPWRDTSYAYAILVAEFMLQKTNAPLVARLYEKFIEKYPTVEALAQTEFIEISNILQLYIKKVVVNRLASRCMKNNNAQQEIKKSAVT